MAKKPEAGKQTPAKTTDIPPREPRNVHQAIIETGRLLKAVAKDQRNKEQNFQYRSIHGLLNALQPAMAEAGLYCHLVKYENLQEETWKTRNGATGRRCTLDAFYKFTAEDGSNIETMVPGEAFDYGDKGIGKALVYAQKNLVLQTFMVPTEDTKDPDENAHDFTEREQHNNGQQSRQPAGPETPPEPQQKKEKTNPTPPVDEGLKKLANTIKEAYTEAPDTGILAEALKEFAADQAKLPQKTQDFLKGAHDNRLADFLGDAYEAAANWDDYNALVDRVKAIEPPLEKTAADRIEKARQAAHLRLDEIPF